MPSSRSECDSRSPLHRPLASPRHARRGEADRRCDPGRRARLMSVAEGVRIRPQRPDECHHGHPPPTAAQRLLDGQLLRSGPRAGSAALNRWGEGASPSSGTHATSARPASSARVTERGPGPPSHRRAGLAHLVMTPAPQAGPGEFDPLAPHPYVLARHGARPAPRRARRCLWKSNRDRSRARPLPGAYREVWRSNRLTSALKYRLFILAPGCPPGSEADIGWPHLSVKQDL